MPTPFCYGKLRTIHGCIGRDNCIKWQLRFCAPITIMLCIRLLSSVHKVHRCFSVGKVLFVVDVLCSHIPLSKPCAS